MRNIILSISVLSFCIQILAQQNIPPQNLFVLSPQEKVLFYPPYIASYTWPTVGFEEPPLEALWKAFDQGLPPVPLNENAGPNGWYDLDGPGSQNHSMLWIGESVLGYALANNVAGFESAAQKAIILLDSLDYVQGHMRHEAFGGYLNFWEGGAACMALAGLYAPAGSVSGPALLKAARRWWSDHIAVLRTMRMPDGQLATVGGRCKGNPGTEHYDLRPAVNLQLIDPQPHHTLHPDLAALLTPDGEPLHGNGGTYQLHWWDPHYVADKWIVLRAFQAGAILRVPADHPTPSVVHSIYRWTSGNKINVATPRAIGLPYRRWHSSWVPGCNRVWIEVADSTLSPGGKGLPNGHLPPSPQVVNIPANAVQILGPAPMQTALPPCSAAGNCTNDAAVVSISMPYLHGCETQVNPRVVIKNAGTNPITELALYYQIDNHTLYTQYALGSVKSKRFVAAAGPGLLPDSTITLTLDMSNVAAGTHSIRVWVMDVNKITDMNAANDEVTMNFEVVSAGHVITYTEDFENTNPGLLPAQWSSYNPDDDGNWFTYSTGTNKAGAFNNFAYTGANGDADEMILPVLDLTGTPNVWMTFDLSHASKPAPTLYDSLEVQISVDCGQSFTHLWGMGGTQLNTVPDQSTLFIPAGPQDYRKEQINLSVYAASSSAILKFINRSRGGNSTLVDNIYVGPLSATPVPAAHAEVEISVYPVPASGMLTVVIPSGPAPGIQMSLMNVLGQPVLEIHADHTGEFRMNLESVEPGVYNLVISSNGIMVSSKKVLVVR